MNKTINVKELELFSSDIRKKVLQMIVSANASHIGSSYSVTDILVYLYHHFLNLTKENFSEPQRDRLILSKGWAVSALYAVLAQKGIIDEALLDEYCKDGSQMIGIATRNGLPGIEATTGSMGHGLPIGVGMALGAKMHKWNTKIVVISSDGECDEGSTWEAILQAGHFKLDNLLLIIDHNKWQSFGSVKSILDLHPLAQKLTSFNWDVKEVNGHDFSDLHKAMGVFPFNSGKPSAIIAHTIKGKGVSVFEDRNEWHYKTPRDTDLEIARKELYS